MNNLLKKNRLILLSSLLLTTILVASCGNKPNSSSLPNSEFSSGSSSENDSWIWWDDVEGGGEDTVKKYNTIDYSIDYLPYNYSADYSETMTFAPNNRVQRYEAELCAALTGKAVVESKTHVGYMQEEATATFTITSSTACKVALIGSLSTDPTKEDGVWFDSQYTLEVNGELINTADCWILPTLAWNSFKDNPIAAIDLVEGENTIKFTGYSGLSNINYISLSPRKSDVNLIYPSFSYSPNLKVEAEDCLLFDCQIEEGTGLSNGKNIGFITDNTSLEFIINASEATKTTFSIRTVVRVDEEYSNKASDRFTISVDGKECQINNVELPPTNLNDENWWFYDYYDVTLAEIDLKKGDNYILFRLSEFMNLDYLLFS